MNEVEKHPKPRKRGRPKGDYTKLIGASYGHLKILKVYKATNGKNGPKVKAKCLICGTITKPRLRDLRSGHTKACTRCLRAERYRQLSEAGVAKLSETEIARIWATRSGGKNREAVAEEFDLPLGVTDFAFRKYQRQLESLINSESGIQMVQKAVQPGIGIAGVAKAKELPFEAARYVIGAVKNKTKQRREMRSDIASDAEWVVSKVNERVLDWEEKTRKSEFTPEELRKCKGKVVGQYASLYDDCVAAQLGHLPADEAKHAKDFLDLAIFTFDKRTSRKGAKLRQIRREKEEAYRWAKLKKEFGTDAEIGSFGTSPSEVHLPQEPNRVQVLER